jgi:hypothetical protein
MDESEFESLLYKLSIKAIHALSGSTQEAFTVQQAIENHAYFRPILSCVQILNINIDEFEGYCKINFALSPKFMTDNAKLTLRRSLYNLNWVFEIQDYDYGEDKYGNKISEEDGIDGWLIKSKIKANYEDVSYSDFEKKDFLKAIQITESNAMR